MTIIVEERLVFKFGPSWEVAKYDDHDVHRKGIGALNGDIICEECAGATVCASCGKKLGQGSKAVDVLGSREGRLYFIEVKDFRGHRIENRKRLRDDLAVEVALKVRDTLAGLMGTLHARGPVEWRSWAASVVARKPKVLLWLEQDITRHPDPRRGRSDLSLEDTLSNKLRWLNPSVLVLDRRASSLPDLEIESLNGRVLALRKLIKAKKETEGISAEEYGTGANVAPDVAREKLLKLCAEDFVRPVSGNRDRFTIGPRWAHFHEEPS